MNTDIALVNMDIARCSHCSVSVQHSLKKRLLAAFLDSLKLNVLCLVQLLVSLFYVNLVNVVLRFVWLHFISQFCSKHLIHISINIICLNFKNTTLLPLFDREQLY